VREATYLGGMIKKSVSRRKFFQLGLTGLGAVAATKTFGLTCETSTGEQTLGPFFPQEGTPINEVREDGGSSNPVYLAIYNDLTSIIGRSDSTQGQVVYVGVSFS